MVKVWSGQDLSMNSLKIQNWKPKWLTCYFDHTSQQDASTNQVWWPQVLQTQKTRTFTPKYALRLTFLLPHVCICKKCKEKQRFSKQVIISGHLTSNSPTASQCPVSPKQTHLFLQLNAVVPIRTISRVSRASLSNPPCSKLKPCGRYWSTKDYKNIGITNYLQVTKLTFMRTPSLLYMYQYIIILVNDLI